MKKQSLVSVSVLLCHAAFLAACQTPDPTCAVPPPAGLLEAGLTAPSFSFDSHYPIAASSLRPDNRLGISIRTADGDYGARIWTGLDWQTWAIPGTAEPRINSVAGKFWATQSSASDFVIYRENSVRDGFEPSVAVPNVSSVSYIEMGGSPTGDQVAVVGRGTLSGRSELIMMENEGGDTWSASAIRPSSPAGSMIPHATGYHSDGTPWVVYGVNPSGERMDFYLSRRVGRSWQAGIPVGTGSFYEYGRLEATYRTTEAGEPEVVFYWVHHTGTGATARVRTYLRPYNLSTQTFSPEETAAEMEPVDSCGSCTVANVAYSPLDQTATFASRHNASGRAWTATAFPGESFSTPAEAFPTYVVNGSPRPIYTTCGSVYVAFIGRPASSAGGLEFFSVEP